MIIDAVEVQEVSDVAATLEDGDVEDETIEVEVEDVEIEQSRFPQAPAEAKTNIRAFLAYARLDVYADSLINAGWDDMKFLLHMDFQDEHALRAMIGDIIQKPGHLRKFVDYYRQVKLLPPPSETAEK